MLSFVKAGTTTLALPLQLCVPVSLYSGAEGWVLGIPDVSLWVLSPPAESKEQLFLISTPENEAAEVQKQVWLPVCFPRRAVCRDKM